MNAPAYPKVHTLSSRALSLLLQGNAITHREFWQRTGTYRLAALIFELREKGWEIRDAKETVSTSDPTKRRAHVKRYFLQNEAITIAGESGKDFVRRVNAWERKRVEGIAGRRQPPQPM